MPMIDYFIVFFPWNIAGSSDRVKLSDVQVLTLKQGYFTAGRRSAGVPQLRCTGGTAGCQAFSPQVVQCYNKGWDGEDFQVIFLCLLYHRKFI